MPADDPTAQPNIMIAPDGSYYFPDNLEDAEAFFDHHNAQFLHNRAHVEKAMGVTIPDEIAPYTGPGQRAAL